MTTMAEVPKILVVDDDPDVLDMVADFLTQHAFTVLTARDGSEARRRMVENPAHLVVIDRSMPGEDGFSLARHIRERYAAGIIMLTAAGSVVDASWAWKSVPTTTSASPSICTSSPPHSQRLAANFRARRRTPRRGPGALRPLRPRSGLAQDVRRGWTEVAVTAMEFDLLLTFSRNANRVLSRDAILNCIQHRDAGPFDRSIDLHIARLRKKIEQDPEKPQAIKTVRGAGYMYVPPVPC